MSHKEHLIDLESQWSAQNYKPLPVVLARGQGCWVEDVDGKRYLDMLAGYSAVNHGHLHPRIVEAAREQLDRIGLTSRAFYNDRMGPLVARLSQRLGYDKAILMNTGAEAVETALKLVRKWGYEVRGVPANRAEIIVCHGNFSGRTISIISFSSEPQYRDAFGPHTPGFREIPYGDAAALEAAITPHTVAFLVEPIQGEGGIVVPPDGFLAEAQAICRRHGIWLVADEIQTGLGRTGYMLACEAEGVHPDMVILGKALGGGIYPVSAVLAPAEVMDVLRPGDHGSTFGGNPLACAIATAALDVLAESDMLENARVQGAYFLDALRAIESPHVEEVRGRGLMIGVVIRRSSGPAREFCYRLAAAGLLTKETHEQVMRLTPPLLITRSEIDHALGLLRQVLM
jgi:ornithine--oxo-acid transaminase